MDYWESHSIGAWFFLRGLGVVYAIAFASLWRQLPGLFSSRGIRPIQEFLEHWNEITPTQKLTTFPTVFWYGASDRVLHLACAAGLAASVAAIGDVSTGPALLICWGLYLSFATVGQEFLSFQWDALLLEAGLVALLVAPWPGFAAPSPLAAILVVWILVRLLFESGVVKLTSGDANWRNLTALDYHHYTQPLPTRFAWYFQQLPQRLHKATTAITFFLELVPPFLIWGPAPVRAVAFVLIVLFQIAIAISGNYGFFNLLTVVLALPLVSDPIWQRLLPTTWIPYAPSVAWSNARLYLELPAATLILLISIPQVRRSLDPLHRGAIWLRKIERAFRHYYVANPYGLFRVMTTRRPELLVEGSEDGDVWLAYRFRFKPEEVTQAPRWSAPHLPRLDWQMWFAALGDLDSNPWLESFLSRLFDGEPAVLNLLAHNPFPETPPRYLRITQSEYEFTTRAERKKNRAWWRAKPLGLYCPVIYRASSSLPEAD